MILGCVALDCVVGGVIGIVCCIVSGLLSGFCISYEMECWV